MFYSQSSILFQKKTVTVGEIEPSFSTEWIHPGSFNPAPMCTLRYTQASEHLPMRALLIVNTACQRTSPMVIIWYQLTSSQRAVTLPWLLVNSTKQIDPRQSATSSRCPKRLSSW